MSKLKVVDLFSGIGGFSLGLEEAGMETVAFCEIDPHARAVLKKHWPDVSIYEDVKKLKGKNFKNIDVICGGFPCQDISVAGKKVGLKGERSGLWSEFKRLIKEIKPRYAIIENVANLRSNGLAQVIQDLWKIGYACEWHIISARSVGAPHLRERIWIIAYPDSERLEGQRITSRVQEKHPTFNGSHDKLTNSNNFRFWQPFASEEEKQEWWSKAASGVSHWKEAQSIVCGVDDGLPDRSHSNNAGMDSNRVKILKDIVESKRLDVDLSTGKIFSLVQRGKKGMRVELKGSDLNGYIVHKIYFNGEKHAFRAHQIVAAFNGLFSENGYLIDHINGNKKDNRACNLRLLTARGNYHNQDRSHIGISDEVAAEMHDIYVNSDISFRDLAEMFECSKSRAQQVVSKHKAEKERKQRIKQLGNAVVPQIPEIIGRAIVEYENRRESTDD